MHVRIYLHRKHFAFNAKLHYAIVTSSPRQNTDSMTLQQLEIRNYSCAAKCGNTKLYFYFERSFH